ncbi:hypothetical protein L915_00028 [Phytophthora nicotianae]|uniref:Uncharacterized protein n=1 Tax=Phytophthora nicotianae TaxID=4792 RepID=W2JWG8_PHYNI|nr:hypothetical protein L915_00028 [Phytophthora nicotianae]ETL50774.1 hypothetical protein L916_00024 [Phytophthora nicotianae]
MLVVTIWNGIAARYPRIHILVADRIWGCFSGEFPYYGYYGVNSGSGKSQFELMYNSVQYDTVCIMHRNPANCCTGDGRRSVSGEMVPRILPPSVIFNNMRGGRPI